MKSLKGVSLYRFEKMTSHALEFPVGTISIVFNLSCELKDQEVCAIIYLHMENRNCLCPNLTFRQLCMCKG